jgi:hypothetical protein
LYLSVHQQATAEIDDLSGDEAGQRRRQKAHHVSELLRLAEASDRSFGQQLLPGMGSQRWCAPMGDDPDVHADSRAGSAGFEGLPAPTFAGFEGFGVPQQVLNVPIFEKQSSKSGKLLSDRRFLRLRQLTDGGARHREGAMCARGMEGKFSAHSFARACHRSRASEHAAFGDHGHDWPSERGDRHGVFQG